MNIQKPQIETMSAVEHSFFMLNEDKRRLEDMARTKGTSLGQLIQEKIKNEINTIIGLSGQERTEYILGLQTAIRTLRHDYRSRLFSGAREHQYAFANTVINLPPDLNIELAQIAEEYNSKKGDFDEPFRPDALSEAITVESIPNAA